MDQKKLDEFRQILQAQLDELQRKARYFGVPRRIRGE